MSTRIKDSIDSETRNRINDMLADYVHCIDDGKIESWPDYFTENGFYQVISHESYEAGHSIGIMHCEGRGMMKDRVLALRKANIFEPHRYCHLLGRTTLRQQSSTIITARTNFSVTRTMQDGGSEMFATGRYQDEITLDGPAPQLKDRRVILDSRRIDILLVFPL